MGSKRDVNEAPRPFYADATLHVRGYDSINNSERSVVRGDTAFYRDLALRSGGEVLEIAVGTGRVALELISSGLQVVGLDASPAMLAIAAEKAAAAGLTERMHLVLGDMRDFDLTGRRFGLVIVAFRSFQVLLTAEDQLAALAAFRRHLRPDGVLAVHLFDPDYRFLLPDAPGPLEHQVGVDRQTGRRLEGIREAGQIDHVAQVRRDVWRYRTFEPDGTVVEDETLELTLRWIFRWEMRHLLRLAGFVVDTECSDFAGSPPAYGKEQIWVAHPGP